VLQLVRCLIQAKLFQGAALPRAQQPCFWAAAGTDHLIADTDEPIRPPGRSPPAFVEDCVRPVPVTVMKIVYAQPFPDYVAISHRQRS